tara:strand:+ start:1530 stop:1817 length:288 start_codon:yes stop_codon:yes gene_type:complete
MKSINRAMDRFIGYLGEEDAAAWDGEPASLSPRQAYLLKTFIMDCITYDDLIELFTTDIDTDPWKEFIDSLLLNEDAIKTAADLYCPEFDYDLGE